MRNVRQFVVRQLQLGILPDIVSTLIATSLLYAFSIMCVAIVRDNIAANRSLLLISNYPIMFVVGGFFISCHLSSQVYKLKLTMQTNVNIAIRFDAAMAVLGTPSYEDIYNFAKTRKVRLYISDELIADGVVARIRGRVYSLMSSPFHSHKDISQHIDGKRAFFDKDEFDCAINNLLSSIQVTESGVPSQGVKSIPETISNLLSAKEQLGLRLDDTIGNHSMTRSRLGKAEKGKRREQQLTNLAIRVAARLGKLHSGNRTFSTLQVQQVLDDVLMYEEGLQKHTWGTITIPKGFAGRVRNWLPPEMKSRPGRPKTSKI